MKRNVRKLNTERKHKDIYTDYCKMFKKNVHMSLIYQKLEKKYYLDEGRIFRIIAKMRKVLPDNKHIKNVT